MGKNIEALSAPMKIGGNIDTRYFTDNGDGTYSATIEGSESEEVEVGLGDVVCPHVYLARTQQ